MTKLILIPYAVVAVKGTSRGTLTDVSGFFSIVVRTDETLVFSVLGFKDAFFSNSGYPDGGLFFYGSDDDARHHFITDRSHLSMA
jgi:hypothetical protein